MENKIEIFENEKFGAVRTTVINNEPWFVGKDIAEALGYKNTRDALNTHVEDGDKADVVIHDGSQNRNMVGINESGMYALIFGSKLEKAKEFKHWVTSEVLPTIRKKGIYMTDQKALDLTTNPSSLADLLVQAGEQLKQKELIIREMKPKVLFAEAVEASHNSILVGELAKLLRQNGVDIGQNRLFKWLRANNYLCKSGSQTNKPTQYSMDLGLFEMKERTIIAPNGSNKTVLTPKVTGKGQTYFVNKFLNESVEY